MWDFPKILVWKWSSDKNYIVLILWQKSVYKVCVVCNGYNTALQKQHVAVDRGWHFLKLRHSLTDSISFFYFVRVKHIAVHNMGTKNTNTLFNLLRATVPGAQIPYLPTPSSYRITAVLSLTYLLQLEIFKQIFLVCLLWKIRIL